MKHEWKKHEKNLYMPKEQAQIMKIPAHKFFQIKGQGNPNDSNFAKYIEVLYGLSYAIKMLPKKSIVPTGYYNYTVYPLEGIWDISEEAKKINSGVLDKNTLVFNLMIRQPEFVTNELASETILNIKNKTGNQLFDLAIFGEITDGKCVQILHVGSYDDEPRSFEKLKKFCTENQLARVSGEHREIYLSDARKVPKEKLKTILRYQVK